jgi:hypothetical protein
MLARTFAIKRDEVTRGYIGFYNEKLPLAKKSG